MSKSLKCLPEKSRNKRRSNRFQWCPLSHPHLYCYRFLPSNPVLHQLYIKTVYNKNLSKQSNLTAQIEPVLDKLLYIPIYNNTFIDFELI